MYKVTNASPAAGSPVSILNKKTTSDMSSELGTGRLHSSTAFEGADGRLPRRRSHCDAIDLRMQPREDTAAALGS